MDNYFYSTKSYFLYILLSIFIDIPYVECAVEEFDDHSDAYDDDDDDEVEDDGAEISVSNFQSNCRKEDKPQPKDRMTELINLQKSNGAFEVLREEWSGSVLEDFLGDYEDVKSNCPPEIAMNL